MNNVQVIKNWEAGKMGISETMSTDGQHLFSYDMPIGVTASLERQKGIAFYNRREDSLDILPKNDEIQEPSTKLLLKPSQFLGQHPKSMERAQEVFPFYQSSLLREQIELVIQNSNCVVVDPLAWHVAVSIKDPCVGMCFYPHAQLD